MEMPVGFEAEVSKDGDGSAGQGFICVIFFWSAPNRVDEDSMSVRHPHMATSRVRQADKRAYQAELWPQGP